MNTNVGRDYSADRLMKEFEAIVLCGGAARPRDLLLEGRSLSGIHFAMDFLHLNTKSLLDSNQQDGCFLSAKDKDVIVIGGGDTGNGLCGHSFASGMQKSRPV